MKKFVRIIAVTLVVVTALAMFAACGYSGDPDKDRDRLEKKDYGVTVSKIPVGDVTATLHGLRTNVNEFTIAELAQEETLKKLKADVVTITYYKDKEAAKSAYDKVKSDEKDHSVKLQGNMIVVSYSVKGKDALGTK